MNRSPASSVARFLGGLLVLVVLMVLAAPETGAISQLGRGVLSTSRTLFLTLLYALPAALLFGVPAGLRPGSLVDRLLQAPLFLVAAVPALAVVEATGLFVPASMSLEVTTVLLAGPWLARGIRDALAARGGASSMAGRVLQETGNLVLVTLPLHAAFGLTAVGPLHLVSGWEAAGFVLPALLCHLTGDLLMAGRSAGAQEPGEVSRTWLGLGALALASGLPLLIAEGAGASMLIALGATAAAAVTGVLVARAARATGPVGETLLTPPVHAPMLLAPLIAVLAVGGTNGHAVWAAVVLGLASAPLLAHAFRRHAESNTLGTARLIASGLAMALGQSLYGTALLAADPGGAQALAVGGFWLLGAAWRDAAGEL